MSGLIPAARFKIVHHTTEGSSAEGAFAAFAKHKSAPHFTVDATTIFQHINTNVAARALRNPPGGVETNRDSAVQIEVVGFAHRAKPKDVLRNVARLCRWIEAQHGVPKVWPNGLPKPARNGQDPGGHNRNAVNWDSKGGHYGHSQAPENTHWDPGYTPDEVQFLMEFDETAESTIESERFNSILESDPGLAGETSHMPDHQDVDAEPVSSPAPTPPPRRRLPPPPSTLPFLVGAGLVAIGIFLVWSSLAAGEDEPQ